MLKKLVLLSITLLLVTGCSKKNEQTNTDIGCGTEDTTGCEISEVTEEIKEYREDISKFTEISYDEAYKRITNGGSLIIYYGFETCPWCQELLPLLVEASDNFEVFYVNMKPDGEDSRVSGHKDYNAYLTNYNLINEFEETEKIYAPTLVEVVNGELLKVHAGTVEGHDAHVRKMTAEEKEQLKEVIKSFFADLNGVTK